MSAPSRIDVISDLRRILGRVAKLETAIERALEEYHNNGGTYGEAQADDETEFAPELHTWSEGPPEE